MLLGAPGRSASSKKLVGGGHRFGLEPALAAGHEGGQFFARAI